MSEQKRSLEEVRAYWAAAAAVEVDKDGLRPTARDPYLQQAVEDAMEPRIWPGAALLDVGCGDGLSTCRFARIAGRAVGVDYIAEYARKAAKLAAVAGVRNATFQAGDVLDLAPVVAAHGPFDIVTSIRCLINITDWGLQKKGLGEIARCVQPGGLYLTSEGWTDGVEGLNRMRAKIGVPPFTVVGYNLTMTRGAFEAEAAHHFEVVDYVSLGFYIFMSRVFQPLFVAPAVPKHDHPVNRTAAHMQQMPEMRRAFEECDYAGVYVLRRKG